MTKMHEVKVSIIQLVNADDEGDNHFRVLLQHPDGSEEISHQWWETRAAAEAAIKQYAKDTNSELLRFQ